MKIKIFAFLIIATLSSCSYTFSGASTEGLKTITVRFFENNAQLVIPTLSQAFTEALKSRIRSQTKLSITPNEGDAVFEGRITSYEIKPVALTSSATPTASNNRLTITISVKYINNIKDHEKEGFDESFTRYYDFPVGGSIQGLQAQAIEAINKQLTEDIFNRAFAQW